MLRIPSISMAHRWAPSTSPRSWAPPSDQLLHVEGAARHWTLLSPSSHRAARSRASEPEGAHPVSVVARAPNAAMEETSLVFMRWTCAVEPRYRPHSRCRLTSAAPGSGRSWTCVRPPHRPDTRGARPFPMRGGAFAWSQSALAVGASSKCARCRTGEHGVSRRDRHEPGRCGSPIGAPADAVESPSTSRALQFSEGRHRGAPATRPFGVRADLDAGADALGRRQPEARE